MAFDQQLIELSGDHVMYINFWYPIAKSEDVVTYEPHRTKVLGQQLIAFRDTDGNAHVLSDVCIHRGAALGKGWVKGNHVVCPYHGWQFGGDGKCTHIPTVDKEQIPARAKVDSYPVQEKYGIVFAFLGDLPEEERPPLHEIEEYDQKGWRANRLVVFELDAYYERSIENGLDPSHNEFVHPAQGRPGMQHDFRKKPLDMKDGPWGSEFLVSFDNQLTDSRALSNEAKVEPEVTAGSGYVGPNQMITWICLSKDQVFHQYFFEAPVDEGRTRIFFVNMRTFMLAPENDRRLVNINLTVAQEDIDLLETLDPVGTPNNPSDEVLVPSDGAVISYRKHLKTWKEKGWRIDMETLNVKRQNMAFAIPCPARRTSGNWVLNPVPLFSPAE
jgi:phenylpropionate dioxygenase-like ring-hydroxylating dioxygenase large terminal subunit